MTATLHRGDALAVLRDLPDASVDAVITDPPYSSGGMVRGDRMAPQSAKYVGAGPDGRTSREFVEFTGDMRDQRAYGYWCALWLGECLRVAKPGAAALLFTDWRQLPETVDALQAGGWVYRGIAVWDKSECGGRPQMGRFRPQAEYVVWGSSGPMPDRIGRVLPGVFRYFSDREKEHATAKPLRLMRDLLQIAPVGGTVLDPFMGSGTTGAAAVLEGRDFIGVELTEHYYRVAEERIRSTERGYRSPAAQMVLGAEEAS
jgi:site-specific DNA-methyltransferase (adenine-specific)